MKNHSLINLTLAAIGLALYPVWVVASEPIDSTDIMEESSEPVEEGESLPGGAFSYSESFVLGVVEGLTEYLPISSTGHLILTNHLFDLFRDEDTANAEKLSEARNAYLIVIQGGAILAVLLIYWQKIWTILLGLMGRNPAGLSLGLKVGVAFLPAAVLGPLLNDWIESKLFNPMMVSVALALGAVAMVIMERRYRSVLKRMESEGGEQSLITDISALSYKSSLFIGLMQCIAMWPGMSRSMVTIVGGYLSNLEAKAAAEFSFMLGLVTLSAASAYSLLGSWDAITTHLEWGPMICGFVVATIVAFLAVKWFVGFLSHHGLYLFAYYRLLLAALILWMWSM